MSASSIDLGALVRDAIAVGRAGATSRHLTDAACALVLDALEAETELRFDALLAPVADSRNPLDESIVASASGRAFVLGGAVAHVAHGATAERFLAVVRSRPFAGRERGLRVYAIDAGTNGLVVTPVPTIDGADAARVTLNSVQVGDERSIGPSRDATGAVDHALDATALVAVGEMLGAADEARKHAMRHVRDRVQFGRPLADRQVVAHRVADMTLACDAVSLLLDDALASTADGARRPEPLAVATAKLAANERLPQVTASAHQLCGGDGYAADQPLHRWHRRVSALAMQHGDRRAMRARCAELLGLPASF